jgi:hypothetical protein
VGSSTCDLGSSGYGVVFNVDAAGHERGTANNLMNGSVFELAPSAQGWTARTIYNFGNGVSVTNLAIDAFGKLYGTVRQKGPTSIFQLTRGQGGKWAESSLCDGCSATGVPVFDRAGNLYVDAKDQILELVRNQNWRMTVIAEFNGSDGSDATGALTFDESGNLYGTTE